MAWLSVLNCLNVGYMTQILASVVCLFLVYKCTKFLVGTANNEQMKCGIVVRRLGFYEAVFDAFSVEREGTGNICLSVTLTSKQSLSYEHVRDALVLLARRQPMLRATITTVENGEKYFEIKEINEVIAMLDITASNVKSSDWKDVWFEYTTKQRGNGLLWRVVILQEELRADTKDYVTTLMFSFNHSTTDGVSCVKFCKQFLRHLNELANGATVNEEIRSLNMLPYYHDIVTQKRTLYSVLNFMLTYCGLRFFVRRMISHEFKTIKCNPYYNQFPPSLDVSSFAGPMRLNAKVFTENETKKILQACKANHCTVTGALTAAANLAFCDLIQDGMKENNDSKLNWKFAINAHRSCDPKPHEDYLGLFLYMFDKHCMKYEPGTDFWKVAQKTTKEIQDVVKAEQYVIGDTMFGETMKANEVLNLLDRDVVIRLSPCNFISSFGSFHFGTDQQEQTYTLNECFINDTGHGYPGTFVHYNHTINGKMTWQITHNASRVQIQHAERFVTLCFGRFIDIARV